MDKLESVLREKYLLIWGLTVAAGWIITDIVIRFTLFEDPSQAITNIWTGIIGVNVLTTYYLLQELSDRFVPVLWLFLSIIGLNITFVTTQNLIGLISLEALIPVWSILVGTGLLVSAKLINGIHEKIYNIFGLLNLAVGLSYSYGFSYPEYIYPLLAILQSVPMLTHYYIEKSSISPEISLFRSGQ